MSSSEKKCGLGNPLDLFHFLNSQITGRGEESFLASYSGHNLGSSSGHAFVIIPGLNPLLGKAEEEFDRLLQKYVIEPAKYKNPTKLQLTFDTLVGLSKALCFPVKKISLPEGRLHPFQIAASIQKQLGEKGFSRLSIFDIYLELCKQTLRPISLPFADLNWREGADAVMQRHDLLSLSYNGEAFYFEIFNADLGALPLETKIDKLYLFLPT